MTPTAATEPGTPALTVRQVLDRLPSSQVLYLIRLVIADGHTIDGATAVVVEALVASGELADTAQLRAVVAGWVALVHRARTPRRRTKAATVIAAEAEAAADPGPYEAVPDTSEER